MPWPISERWAVRVTWPSTSIDTNRFGANAVGRFGTARARPAASSVPPRTTAPAPAAMPFSKVRRLKFSNVSLSDGLRRRFDRRADPPIRAAAADVRHNRLDLLVGRLRLFREALGFLHDLPGRALPAPSHRLH